MKSLWKNLQLYEQVKTKTVLRKWIIDLKTVGTRKTIYNGHALHSYPIRPNMSGYKYGEFCNTRYSKINKSMVKSKHKPGQKIYGIYYKKKNVVSNKRMKK